MKKRITSLLLALVMCLSLLPAATASAYYDDYYGSGHTHYLCGAGSSSYDYYGSGSCTCSPKENAKTYFTTELTRSSDGTLKKGNAAWSATGSNYVLEGGTYYLASNLTLEHGILITGDVTLCLNGYSIICDAGADTSNPVPVITVSETKRFTLTNCRSQTYWDYKITHTEGKYGCGVYNEGTFNMYGGNITGNMAINYAGVYNKGTFNLYGGKISDNKAVGNESTFNNGEGGGVYNEGTFKLSGGTISGNTAGYYGGGVYNKGTFELSGGTISGNSAAQGGGVYSWGSGATFTMSGGVIGGTKENSVNTAEYYGGGVSNQSDSTFTMSGGLIAGNKVTASNIGAGGGVFNNAAFTMSGGKIGGSEAGKNTSANLGGGVYTSGTFTMSGSAEVSYNTAASKGGGVYNNCSTFSLTDGSITNNTAATGGGVYCDRSDNETGNVTLSGKARIANNHAEDANSNLYLLKNGTVAANGLTAGAGIGVSTAVDVASSQLNVAVTSDTVSANYFTSDNTSYITQIAGNSGTGCVVLTQRSTSTTHDHSCVCGATHVRSNGHDTAEELTNWVGISDLNLITGAGNYYLTDNVTLTEAIAYDSGSYCGWKAPDGVVLCLNGKNITMENPDDLVYESGKAKNADVILVAGRFTLTDCASMQGKITHATDKIGRGITVLGGAFDMYGGQITGNQTTNYGTAGGVLVEGAEDAASSTTFNLYGGSINANQSGYGGGVYVTRVVWEGASQFNMYGGSITGNTSTVTDETSSYGIGGGVCVSWTAAFQMTGGSITGNTAKFDGAGVYLSALAKNYASETGEQRTAKFEVSGSPNITGNKVNNAENNVYLDTDTQTNTYSGFTNTVDASITILEGLSNDAKIGVTAKKAPTLGNRTLAATGATPNKDYKNIFTSDDASYEVQNRNDGTLRLAVNGDSSADSSHVHNWTYAIKEGAANTIVATCNAPNCPNPNGGSVTLNAPAEDTLTYDGTAKEAALTNAFDSSNGITVPTITYRHDDEALSGAPANAGTYTASITLGEATASATYTIKSKPITGAVIIYGTQATYNGSAQDVAVASVTLDNQTLTLGIDYTLDTATATATNVEKKALRINGLGNYTGTAVASESWSLQKATPTVPTGLYGVVGQKLSTVQLPDGWSWVSGEMLMNTQGAQEFQANYAEDNNHTAASNVNVTVNVTDKTIQSALNITGDSTVTYGNTLRLTAEGGTTKNAVKWSVKNGSGSATIDENGVLTPISAGDVTVTATMPGNDTYADVSATRAVAIDKATVVITALNKIAYVGAAAPDLKSPVLDKDYTVTGLVRADVLGGTITLAYAEEPDMTRVNDVTINISGATASDNYKINFVDGKLVITNPPSSGGSYTPTYSVNVPGKTENGTVTVSPKNARKGSTVTITIKPDSGYQLGNPTVTDSKGNELKLTDKGDGKYTFTMPAGKVEVKATFIEKAETSPFTDVSTDAYYYEAVKWAAENGITGGIGNALFGPNQPCTRAQIVTFLWRAAGSPEPKSMSSFSDVSADSYYAKAVAWAVENGIAVGTGNGKFSPDATCTRAQSVTFLCRAAGKPVEGEAAFSDVPADSYYANAVAWAVKNNVTNGIGDGLFGPNNSCTRAQIVTFLYRTYQG